jgi:two-component system sensor histidine kinase KdpD
MPKRQGKGFRWPSFEFAKNTLWPSLLSLVLTAAMTACLLAASSLVDLNHVSIVYLIPVLIAAVRWGVVPGIISALAGGAASAFFFYPPIYDFRVSDPGHFIDLVLFLVVAVVTSHLATSVRSREHELRVRTEAETFRDALIGSVSHELRTPLASIVGSTYLLADAPGVRQDARLAALADDVRHEAERLNDDIQNLLDASRITNAGIQPRLQWTDVSDIVNAVVERKQRKLSGHRLEVDVPDELPLVHADPVLIEQALAQVLDNAAKYSPAGSLIRIAAGSGNEEVSVAVADQGAGLTDEERGRIWERFYRSPRHHPTSTGSGLGLWIARAFVLATGGRVEARSAGPERGTTVTIRLPAPHPTTADDTERPDE